MLRGVVAAGGDFFILLPGDLRPRMPPRPSSCWLASKLTVRGLDHVDPDAITGEAASVMTCIDGYATAKRGRAGAALTIAAVGSSSRAPSA